MPSMFRNPCFLARFYPHIEGFAHFPCQLKPAFASTMDPQASLRTATAHGGDGITEAGTKEERTQRRGGAVRMVAMVENRGGFRRNFDM